MFRRLNAAALDGYPPDGGFVEITKRPLVADRDFRLYEGDALEILELFPAGAVDAVVTSPPYGNVRSDVAGVELDRFVDWLAPILELLLRALRPTGSLLLNLGRRFHAGEESGYAYDVLAAAKAQGWRHIDSIVWHKPNGNPRGGPYLLNFHEHVFWLAPSTDAYRGFDQDTRTPYAFDSIARYGRGYQWAAKFDAREKSTRTPHPDGRRPGSVVTVYTGREKGNPHPTPMPEELARLLVALSCRPGGTVLDPFLGSGTTALAARALGRRCVGIELEPAYAAIAAGRLSQLPLELEAR